MPGNHLKVTCRPARVEDTTDVMELTRTIWEGGDYVPRAWQGWLADTQGVLAVAEHTGRVLGLGKLTLLASGQWWLEGLRTHPEYEGRGIAASLHAYLVDAWLRKGDGTLRLATASFRKAVQHLCDQSGFTKVGEFSPYQATALQGNAQNFQPLEENQARAALASLQASPVLALCSGLIDLGWEWCAPFLDYVVESAHQGRTFWWRAKRGLIVLREDRDDERGEALLSPQTLACQVEDLAELLSDCRRMASSLGYQNTEWHAPLQPAAMDALDKAGYERSWEASIYIYARMHPKSKTSETV